MVNYSAVKIIKDTSGKERVMIRVDKTLDELMKEKPSSRWDPDYWHPMHEEMLAEIDKKYQIAILGSLLGTPIIAPDHVRASKGEKIGASHDVEYRTLKDLLFTGLNYSHTNYCSDNAYQRLKRSQLILGDILFAGSGIGAIGRIGIVEHVSNKSCVGDLFIIRNTKVNRYYLYIYLLTKFGQLQIEKIFHGIQSAKISTSEIEMIKVPILPELVQANIESEFKKISLLHDRAMERKKNGEDNEYEKYLNKAEKILLDFISRTEAVIRGERDDI